MLKEPRVHDEDFLRRIRLLPCMVPNCREAFSDAAHIRLASASYQATEAGIGAKPHDFWVLPLCHHHHMGEHNMGTEKFWRQLRMDPHFVALRLYAIHRKMADDLSALPAMRLVVLEERFTASE